jgi:hypothetical protein
MLYYRHVIFYFFNNINTCQISTFIQNINQRWAKNLVIEEKNLNPLSQIPKSTEGDKRNYDSVLLSDQIDKFSIISIFLRQIREVLFNLSIEDSREFIEKFERIYPEQKFVDKSEKP